MKYKYIKPLESTDNINSFESSINFVFPEDFKVFVKNFNGSTPEHAIFDTDVCLERVIKTFLSFNQDDKESVWTIYVLSRKVHKHIYAPFAIDVFGNLICFDDRHQVIFIDHETLSVEFVAVSFNEFINKLYKEA